MFTLKILGESVGVQYQGIVDRTTSNSFANALGVGLIVGRFKRGRTDKPMLITPDTVRGRLGYEPNNPYYQAVQSALDAGVPSIYVLRVGDAPPAITCTPTDIVVPVVAVPDGLVRIYYTLNGGPQVFWEGESIGGTSRDLLGLFFAEALEIVVGGSGGIGAFQYISSTGAIDGGVVANSVELEPVETMLTLDIAPNTNTETDLVDLVFGEAVTLTACANNDFAGV